MLLLVLVMNDFLRVFLPLYFLVFFGIAFVGKSVIVARKTGKSPLVFPRDKSVSGLIGMYFKLTLLAVFAYVMLYALIPNLEIYLAPLLLLSQSYITYTGLTLLLISLIWTIAAQVHMKDSWRIGIDTESKTALITGGLFSISRNPIFLGMLLALSGLFLVTPNAPTMLFLVLGYVLIRIQIQFEEEFLSRQHGNDYLEYMKKVRRFI